MKIAFFPLVVATLAFLGVAAHGAEVVFKSTPQEDLAQLECVQREDPFDPGKLYVLAIAYESMRRIAEARTAYERALAVVPRSGLLYGGLGWIDYLEGRYQDAEELSRRALLLDPELGAAAYNVGLTYVARGSFCQAVEAYEEAMQRDGSRRSLMTALHDLVDFAQDHPDSASAHYCAALIDRAVGTPGAYNEALALQGFLKLGGPPAYMDAAYKRLAELVASENASSSQRPR